MKAGFVTAAAVVLAACGQAPEPTGDQDFAVLARSEAGFRQAMPGTPLEFPRDHGAHPDFRIEWWYLTANLQDLSGREFGAQWTLFRTATRPPDEPLPDNPWQDPQVYMAHMAITSPEGHRAFQRYARGGDHAGLAQAGVSADPFVAWLDDWALQSTGPGWLPLSVHARQERFAMDLRLTSDQPLVLQGDNGFSRKHPSGGGSHYYSQPFLRAAGMLEVDGVAVEVTGQAWLDREWSSQFLQPDQAGWDWLSLHLDSGEKLMLFRLRSADAAAKHFLHATLIAPDGARLDLDPEHVRIETSEQTTVAGRELPLHWRLQLPQIERSLDVRALHPEQWMEVDFAYWEGVVLATGDHPGSRGRGYLELTGYPSVR